MHVYISEYKITQIHVKFNTLFTFYRWLQFLNEASKCFIQKIDKISVFLITGIGMNSFSSMSLMN